VRISEQPLITNDGIPTEPTHLEGLKALNRLAHFSSRDRSDGKKSEVTVSVGVTDKQHVLKIDSK
jgi:hypothetical protein